MELVLVVNYLLAHLLAVGPQPVLQLLHPLLDLPSRFPTPGTGEYLAPWQSRPALPVEARGDEKLTQVPENLHGPPAHGSGFQPVPALPPPLYLLLLCPTSLPADVVLCLRHREHNLTETI